MSVNVSELTEIGYRFDLYIIVECDGSYGDGCAFDCSKRHCKYNTTGCSHVDGSCGGECQENYNGTDCTGIPEQEYIIRLFLICLFSYYKMQKLTYARF